MKHTFYFLVIFLFHGSLLAQNSSSGLNNLFDEISNYESKTTSVDSIFKGHHPQGNLINETIELKIQKANKIETFIKSLEDFPEEGLSRQEIISKEVMMLRLGDQLSHLRFEQYLIPMNAEGGFYNALDEKVISSLPFNTKADYENYLQWLPRYIDYLRGMQDLLVLGKDKGMIAPRPVIDNAIELSVPYRSFNYEDNPFYVPFKKLPDDLSEVEKITLPTKGMQMITDVVQPFYNEFIEFLSGPYETASPELPGILSLPKGKEFYENRIKFYTTFEITPDSVHQIGLQEVKRIRGLMESVISEVGFDGSFEEFLTFLRTDPQFYAKTPEELLMHAAWLSKKAEAGLPKLFNTLYSLPFTVAPVPDAIASTYTAGRYVPGSWKHQRPGTYWVNTYKLDSRPLYSLPALTLHEAVPGHHLHFALVSELKGLPEFRNTYYISAFGEGWGLYSEYLGEEMGMYSTPYEWFGRYTYEMWRACRLVVDTGIHYMGWSREEAINYMKNNTALSLHEVKTEIDRYIGWPGQAVSYKIGELKIKALRAYAQKELGDRFNLGEFHNEILKNGSIPLDVLQQEIESYVERKMMETK